MMNQRIHGLHKTSKDEVDSYIDLKLDNDKNYSSSLVLWKEHQ